jgi:hypothetical protein
MSDPRSHSTHPTFVVFSAADCINVFTELHLCTRMSGFKPHDPDILVDIRLALAFRKGYRPLVKSPPLREFEHQTSVTGGAALGK